jgi:hypothetical protein
MEKIIYIKKIKKKTHKFTLYSHCSRRNLKVKPKKYSGTAIVD